MYKAHIVVDEIKMHNPEVSAMWTTTDRGDPQVVIRKVMDVGKQELILSWAKTPKRHGRVRHPITLVSSKKSPTARSQISRSAPLKTECWSGSTY